MKLSVLLLPFLLLGETKAPPALSNVRQWLPLNVGDCWVYETEILSGDRHRPTVEHWQEAETTVAVHHIAEGLLVQRRVAYIKGAVPQKFVNNPSESNILVHDNCIYFVNEITPALRDALAGHTAQADVCFPLEPGATWGSAQPGRSLWSVRGRGRKDAGDPMSANSLSWRLEASLATGDTNHVWFQRNVGMVAKRTRRSGQYYDYRVRLLSFQSGKAH
jgi:hypothetical protein